MCMNSLAWAPGRAKRFAPPMNSGRKKSNPWRGRREPGRAEIENAGGVPESSRGLSDQRERHPRWASKETCTPEGCQSRADIGRVLRPLRGREVFIAVDRGCRRRTPQPPATFRHPFRMPRPEREALQNAVTATDQPIDQLVYELYRLTPNEVSTLR